MTRTFKFLGVVFVIILVAIGVASQVFKQEIARYNYQTSLFTGVDQSENFIRQEDFYPIKTMGASETPRPLPLGPQITLPDSFTFEEETFNTDAFLQETDTAALLILKDGQILYENYWLTAAIDEPWHSHSLSKSVVSAAVGLAIEDGHIDSVDDPISDYAPLLKESGYNNVSIKDVLQMSSGIRWNEDYGDPESDMRRVGIAMLLGSSYDRLVASMVRENEPGTYRRYTGMDTQALTYLVAEATGRSLPDYLEDRLWKPLGAEHDAFWTTDRHGRALGLGGLNATARDFARIGELYRRGGNWDSDQILPEAWVRASINADELHLRPGENPLSAHRLGYGYQWWIPNDRGDFVGLGIYNQFIYVSPESKMVIVKLSCNRFYASEDNPRAYRELETFALFDAIIRSDS